MTNLEFQGTTLSEIKSEAYINSKNKQRFTMHPTVRTIGETIIILFFMFVLMFAASASNADEPAWCEVDGVMIDCAKYGEEANSEG